MVRARVFSIVVLGVFLAASAGFSLAGGNKDKSGCDGKAGRQEKSVRHGMESPYSEMRTGGYGEAGVPAGYRGPVETGSMPGAEEGGGMQDTGVDPERWEKPDTE